MSKKKAKAIKETTIEVVISGRALKLLDRLVKSGLYGKNRSEAIERIVANDLVRSSHD